MLNVPAIRAIQQDLRDHPEGFSMSFLSTCLVARAIGRDTVTALNRQDEVDHYPLYRRSIEAAIVKLGLTIDQAREVFTVNYFGMALPWMTKEGCHWGGKRDAAGAILYLDEVIAKWGPKEPEPTPEDVDSALETLEEVSCV